MGSGLHEQYYGDPDLRRVIVRIAAKFDWFVIKHLSALSADTGQDETINALRSTLLLAAASSLVLAGCALKIRPLARTSCLSPLARKIPGSWAGRIAAAPWCRTGSAISATRS
ncbi:MAG: hypothetical protein Udaeo2_22590 [Candidatus Udaeobacter sp.]|nr:MAG: hypothetical protein Udaeo2_22590 [Candidatus Udaeobacter sp.]